MLRSFIASALLFLGVPAARANSAPPATYWLHEPTPGTVGICPSAEVCPNRVLLRRDVATGAVVSMRACEAGGSTGCYVDECVPAGTYQYGFEVPYACDERWGAYYYAELQVAGAPATCTRTVPAPAAAASVPWKTSDVICKGSYGADGPFGCSSAGGVVGLNLVAIGVGLALRSRTRRAG